MAIGSNFWKARSANSIRAAAIALLLIVAAPCRSGAPMGATETAAATTATIGVAGNQEAIDAVQRAQELERDLQIFEAAAVLDEAAASPTATAGLREFRAWFLHRYQFREEAIAGFEQMLPNVADAAPIHEMLGWNRRALGQSQQALEHLRHAYEVPAEPLSEADAFDRILKQSRARLDRQIEAARADLAATPGDFNKQRQLLELLQYAGEHEEIIELSQRILADHPDDALIALSRAGGLEALRRYEDAQRAFRAMLDVRANSAYLWYRLGRVQQAMQQNEQAIESLRHADELFPNSIYVRRPLAELLAAEGREDEAFVLIPPVNEPAGRSLEARLARAHAHHFSGDLRSAAPIYRDILHDYPHHAEALHGLSEALVYTGRYRESAEIIDRAAQAGQLQTVREAQALYDRHTAPRVNFYGSAYLNSEQFRRYDGGLNASWRAAPDLAIEGAYQFSRFVQRGFTSIDRHFTWVGGELNPADDLAFTGRIGASTYDTGNENLYARAGTRWNATDQFTLFFDYERLDVTDIETGGDFLIFNQSTIGAAALGTDAHQFSPAFHFTPVDRLDWHGKLSFADFSDGNERLAWWTEVLYRLCDEPQFHVGYSYYFLDVNNPAPLFTQNGNTVSAYFDPTDFEAHTLLFRLADDLNDRWRAGVEQRLSYIPKADGIGSGTFAFLTYELSTNTRLRADVRYFHQSKSVGRTGPGGAFDAAQFVLGLECTF